MIEFSKNLSKIGQHLWLYNDKYRSEWLTQGCASEVGKSCKSGKKPIELAFCID